MNIKIRVFVLLLVILSQVVFVISTIQRERVHEQCRLANEATAKGDVAEAEKHLAIADNIITNYWTFWRK